MRSTLTFALSSSFLILAAGCDTRSRNHGADYSRTTCRANLQMLQSAKETWMLEHRKTTNDIPPDFDLFGAAPALMREKPTCPSGGSYTIGRVGEKPRCSVTGHTL